MRMILILIRCVEMLTIRWVCEKFCRLCFSNVFKLYLLTKSLFPPGDNKTMMYIRTTPRVTTSRPPQVPHNKTMMYIRTTPRVTTSRPPQVPPIPELYNIPPEARYVPCPPGFGGSPVSEQNGSLRNHHMLNSSSSPENTSFSQSNGRILNNGHNNGPLLSPGGRSPSILTTFVPNPSPNNIEHEGHLV